LILPPDSSKENNDISDTAVEDGDALSYFEKLANEG